MGDDCGFTTGHDEGMASLLKYQNVITFFFFLVMKRDVRIVHRRCAQEWLQSCGHGGAVCYDCE